MNRHAYAALETPEGSLRAKEDFDKGIDANPFGAYAIHGWRHAAYAQRRKALTNFRDCRALGNDPHSCCFDQHLQHWKRSQWGIKSCPRCEDRAEVERARIEAEHSRTQADEPRDSSSRC